MALSTIVIPTPRFFPSSKYQTSKHRQATGQRPPTAAHVARSGRLGRKEVGPTRRSRRPQAPGSPDARGERPATTTRLYAVASQAYPPPHYVQKVTNKV